jgi:hypothetical protein
MSRSVFRMTEDDLQVPKPPVQVDGQLDLLSDLLWQVATPPRCDARHPGCAQPRWVT